MFLMSVRGVVDSEYHEQYLGINSDNEGPQY